MLEQVLQSAGVLANGCFKALALGEDAPHKGDRVIWHELRFLSLAYNSSATAVLLGCALWLLSVSLICCVMSRNIQRDV